MTRLVPLSLIAAALVLSGAACGRTNPAAPVSPSPSASPEPSSRASIAIITPTRGDIVRSPTVHVKVRITGASPARTADPQPLPGWLHLYLDGKIMSIQPVPSSNSVMEHALRHVKPGRHLLRAEFVQPNHLPWRPSVAATVTFTVRGP